MIEVYATSNISEQYNEIKENLLGSRWQFDRVESYDINVAPFNPLSGGTYLDLPPELKNKHALLNGKNDDDKCFAASINAAIFRRKKNAESYNDELKKNMKKLNWEGIEFPAHPGKALSEKFDRINPGYAINLYGYDEDEKEKFSVLRFSDKVRD